MNPTIDFLKEILQVSFLKKINFDWERYVYLKIFDVCSH